MVFAVVIVDVVVVCWGKIRRQLPSFSFTSTRKSETVGGRHQGSVSASGTLLCSSAILKALGQVLLRFRPRSPARAVTTACGMPSPVSHYLRASLHLPQSHGSAALNDAQPRSGIPPHSSLDQHWGRGPCRWP